MTVSRAVNLTRDPRRNIRGEIVTRVTRIVRARGSRIESTTVTVTLTIRRRKRNRPRNATMIVTLAQALAKRTGGRHTKGRQPLSAQIEATTWKSRNRSTHTKGMGQGIEESFPNYAIQIYNVNADMLNHKSSHDQRVTERTPAQPALMALNTPSTIMQIGTNTRPTAGSSLILKVLSRNLPTGAIWLLLPNRSCTVFQFPAEPLELC